MKLVASLLLVLLTLLSSGCGLGYRMTAGPTVDLDGHVGAELRVSAAVYLGQRRHVAIVADGGGGVTGPDHDGGPRIVVGNDWAVLPTGGWGYRVGYRVGWLHAGGDDALVVGPDVALLHALGHLGKASTALGLDLRCDQRFGLAASDQDCGLGVVFEITNLYAADRGPYY